MGFKEGPPINRPGIDCKKAIKCSDCLPKGDIFDCQNVTKIAGKGGRVAEQLPLSRIENIHAREIFRPGRLFH